MRTNALVMWFVALAISASGLMGCGDSGLNGTVTFAEVPTLGPVSARPVAAGTSTACTEDDLRSAGDDEWSSRFGKGQLVEIENEKSIGCWERQ